MSPAATKPHLSAVLSQVATIVSVRTSSLGLMRLDKQASVKSDQMANAKVGTGRTSASRLAGAEQRVKDIQSVVTEATAVVKAHTTEWDGGGAGERLIANTMLKTCLDAYMPLKREYDRLVQQFIDDAPALVAQAEQNKGNYNVKVPTVDEIKDAFRMEFKVRQLPDSSTYKASGVTADMEAILRQQFEKGIEAAHANAVKDALQRVAKPLGALVERMGAYQGKGQGREGTFKDTLVTNIQDIAKVFGSFNLVDDPFMKDLSSKLAVFDHLEANDLRNSEVLRKDMQAKAAAIVDSLKDLI